MAYLGCTMKLAKELGEKPFGDLKILEGLEGWHLNLVLLARRKCVLAVNDQTRFTLLLTGLAKPDFMTFEKHFWKALSEGLRWIGLSRGRIAEARLLMGNLEYGKTHSRSVLGTLNEMAYQLEFLIRRLGRLPFDEVERMWISQQLNNMPCGSIHHSGYLIPTEEVKNLVEGI